MALVAVTGEDVRMQNARCVVVLAVHNLARGGNSRSQLACTWPARRGMQHACSCDPVARPSVWAADVVVVGRTGALYVPHVYLYVRCS